MRVLTERQGGSVSSYASMQGTSRHGSWDILCMWVWFGPQEGRPVPVSEIPRMWALCFVFPDGVSGTEQTHLPMARAWVALSESPKWPRRLLKGRRELARADVPSGTLPNSGLSRTTRGGGTGASGRPRPLWLHTERWSSSVSFVKGVVWFHPKPSISQMTRKVESLPKAYLAAEDLLRTRTFPRMSGSPRGRDCTGAHSAAVVGGS